MIRNALTLMSVCTTTVAAVDAAKTCQEVMNASVKLDTN